MLLFVDVLTVCHVMFVDAIEWPDDDSVAEWQGCGDAKNLIQQLLMHDPLERLGSAGAQQVKDHAFFDGLDWNSILRQKAEFVPQLSDEEDTSYFDSQLVSYLLSSSSLVFLCDMFGLLLWLGEQEDALLYIGRDHMVYRKRTCCVANKRPHCVSTNRPCCIAKKRPHGV